MALVQHDGIVGRGNRQKQYERAHRNKYAKEELRVPHEVGSAIRRRIRWRWCWPLWY